MERVYNILEIVLHELRSSPGPSVLGGDFKACFGGVQPGDDMNLVERWGCGARNARGRTFVNSVFENGFQNLISDLSQVL